MDTNMNTNETDSTMDTIVSRGDAQKKNYGKLPKIKYFRVQSRGAVGTMDNRHDRSVSGWAILVDCGDRRGLRLVTDIAYEMGMIIKGEFKTKQAAYDAAMEYKAKWGKTTAKGKADEKKLIEALRNMSEEQIMAMIAASKKAA